MLKSWVALFTINILLKGTSCKVANKIKLANYESLGGPLCV